MPPSENELIFGMLTPEVNNLKQVGYHPSAFIMGDDVANAALNFLERGWNGEDFHEVTENLRTSDPYMVMADFKDYRRAQADLQRLYADREKWAQMSLKNTANSGIFQRRPFCAGLRPRYLARFCCEVIDQTSPSMLRIDGRV